MTSSIRPTWHHSAFDKVYDTFGPTNPEDFKNAWQAEFLARATQVRTDETTPFDAESWALACTVPDRFLLLEESSTNKFWVSFHASQVRAAVHIETLDPEDRSDAVLIDLDTGARSIAVTRITFVHQEGQA